MLRLHDATAGLGALRDALQAEGLLIRSPVDLMDGGGGFGGYVGPSAPPLPPPAADNAPADAPLLVAAPLSAANVQVLWAHRDLLPIVDRLHGVQFDALSERVCAALVQSLTRLTDAGGFASAVVAQQQGNPAGIESLMRTARLSSMLLHHLISRHSNASHTAGPHPSFYVKGEDMRSLAGLTALFQERVAAHTFIPINRSPSAATGKGAGLPSSPAAAKSAATDTDGASPATVSAQELIVNAPPAVFAKYQFLARSTLVHLWTVLALGAVCEPDASLELIAAKRGTAHSSALSLCTYDAALRSAHLGAVVLLLEMILAAPRADNAVDTALVVLERCVLDLPPLCRWRGNQRAVTNGWATLLYQLVNPAVAKGKAPSLAALLASHADVAARLSTLVTERLVAPEDAKEEGEGEGGQRQTPSAHGTIVDVAVLSMVDPDGYMAVLGEVAAMPSEALAASRFAKGLFTAPSPLTPSLSAPPIPQAVALNHLKLLLSVGMVSIVCGPHAGTAAPPAKGAKQPQRASALPQPTAHMRALRKRVSYYAVGMPMPCAPLDPAVSAFLLDAVLLGYLGATAAVDAPPSQGTKQQTLTQALEAMPTVATVATRIVQYPALGMAIRTMPAQLGARIAQTLQGLGASVWGRGCAEEAPPTNATTSGGTKAAERGELAAKRLGDAILHVGILLMDDVVGVAPADAEEGEGEGEGVEQAAEQQSGESPTAAQQEDATAAGGSDGPAAAADAAVPVSRANALACLDAVGYMAALPSELGLRERVVLVESFVASLAKVVGAGAGTGPAVGMQSILSWAEGTVSAVLSDERVPCADSTNSTSSEEAQPAQRKPSLASSILVGRLVVPLTVLSLRDVVMGASNAMLLKVWVPTAVAALTRCLGLAVGACAELLGTLGHDVLVAPIKNHRAVASLILPTYVALFAPNPAATHNTNRYPLLPVPVLKYFAAFVRPTVQALERCYAGPAGSLITADALLEEHFRALVSATPGSAASACANDGPPFSAVDKDGAGSAPMDAISGMTVLGGELLLVQALGDAVGRTLKQRYEATMARAMGRTVPPADMSRLPVYMNALLFLLLVGDPRVLAKVCAGLERILLTDLKGFPQEQDFWMKHIENVIAASSLETTKTGLLLWWMRLGQQLRGGQMPAKL